MIKVDADEWLCAGHGHGAASHFDAARLPWRDNVVDHDGCSSRLADISVLLGRSEVVPAHVDGVAIRVDVQPTGTTCGVPSELTVAIRPSRRSP